MQKEDDKGGLERLVRALTDQINVLRRELAAVERRLSKLEVREELAEAPDAAGDEPVAG